MSAQGNKFRNRPEEDPSTRRTAEDEIMRGDRGVGQTGGGDAGGSGTAGGGLENEGSGSLLIDEADDAVTEGDRAADERDEDAGSGSTKGGSAPGVSGQRGMTGGLEKEGEGHSGPVRSGSQGGAQRQTQPDTERDRAGAGKQDDNAREGYEDQGSSRDADGTQGESSGSRPGYR